MSVSTAILIVNGGTDSRYGKWLQLCIEKIQQHSGPTGYHLYVWNNNTSDRWVTEFISALPNTTLLSADPNETLAHPHAVPLQRLYEQARADGATYIVTLDTDAHPIRDGWLETLTSALDERTVLAGVWRDELSQGIQPYVHASCLCTTVEFIERNRLRLDFIAPNTDTKHDTLSGLTETARELGLGIHKLRRSNRNQVHRLFGGIYGDLIYHHAAGSRVGINFWDRPRSERLLQENQWIRDQTSAWLFRHHQQYIDWLRGSADFIFILGMHRSGTSCLAGALERCGLFLGDVSRTNRFNERGNHELAEVTRLHDAILAENGGSWSQPPQHLVLNAGHRESLRRITEELSAHRPCGLKDPRLLLLIDEWMDLAGQSKMIGAYRHPVAVAQSLQRRNKLSADHAYKLWVHYNRQLVRLHERVRFPLVKFDLSSVDAYALTVAAAGVALGLNPDWRRLRAFVSEELDHSARWWQRVPSQCREVYEYLERHRYQPGVFERSIAEFRREQSDREKEFPETTTAPARTGF
jgi:hypothetical protein